MKRILLKKLHLKKLKKFDLETEKLIFFSKNKINSLKRKLSKMESFFHVKKNRKIIENTNNSEYLKNIQEQKNNIKLNNQHITDLNIDINFITNTLNKHIKEQLEIDIDKELWFKGQYEILLNLNFEVEKKSIDVKKNLMMTWKILKMKY